jgi:predicted nucleic acid-binding protein
MAGCLLDTNVISETRRAKANPSVTAFIASASANELFVSALTVGELWKGVALKRRTDKPAGDQLAGWVQGIETLFANQVLPVDAAVARIWGELCAAKNLPVVDAAIAATALAHGLTLVTRNTKDFALTGVPILNPWQI